MLAVGGAFLIGACSSAALLPQSVPYGGLLALCSRLALKGVTITPDKEQDCDSPNACPYGSIERMRAVRRNSLYCRAATLRARAMENWRGPEPNRCDGRCR